MKLSKKAEYALRAMIALAQAAPESVTITRIALDKQIPKKFLEHILLALKGAGLVASKAGPRGGYELAHPLEQITLGQILDAVDEPLSQIGDTTSRSRTPAVPIAGRIHELVLDIRRYVRARLDSVTLFDLASEQLTDDQVEQLMWYI